MMQTIPMQAQDPWLMTYLNKINPAFTESQLKNASRICQGLASSHPHKSIVSMTNSFIDAPDQSTVNRFLTESEWHMEPHEIDLKKIGLMQQHRQTGFKDGGLLIIDDTLLHKTGSSMELVSDHFDHVSFQMKKGTSLVTAHYADDTKDYNLLNEVYLRKKDIKESKRPLQFKSKVDIASNFIETLADTFPGVQTKNLKVLFDSWFLASAVVGTVEKYGLKYVSRAKSNRLITELDMNLQEYGADILRETDFKEVTVQTHGRRCTSYIYTAILPISNLGDVKVSFVKNCREGEIQAFVVSNDLQISGSKLLQLYKDRWSIETNYKNCKQYLGLDDFHIRKALGIKRYLSLCFLMSAYLERCKLLGIFGHCFGSDIELATKGAQIRAYRHILFERFLTWTDEQLARGNTLKELLIHFRDEQCSCRSSALQFVTQGVRSALKKGKV
ncbi:MAG: transposase [Promethearchaeia archaeon]